MEKGLIWLKLKNKDENIVYYPSMVGRECVQEGIQPHE